MLRYLWIILGACVLALIQVSAFSFVDCSLLVAVCGLFYLRAQFAAAFLISLGFFLDCFFLTLPVHIIGYLIVLGVSLLLLRSVLVRRSFLSFFALLLSGWFILQCMSLGFFLLYQYFGMVSGDIPTFSFELFPALGARLLIDCIGGTLIFWIVNRFTPHVKAYIITSAR